MRFDAVVGPEPESPLAVFLERVLELHIADTTTLIREFECPTSWATFRIDLVAQTPTHRIGFECDGKDFHDSYRDEVRDSLILGSGCVDTIYRLPGDQVNFAIHDLLYIVSLYDPAIFTDRGRKVLLSQACDSVREHIPDGYGGSIFGTRSERGDPRIALTPLRLRLSRHSRQIPSSMSPFWQTIYQHALQYPHLRFTEYLAMRLKEMDSAF